MPSRADTFVQPDDDPRTEPPLIGDERDTLLGFLNWYRGTLELKCAGLTAEELARRSVEPSTMSLLGLIRHMADVERAWFRRVMAGEDAPRRYYSDDNPDGDFDDAVADEGVVAEARAALRDEIDFANRFVAAAPDLDVVGHNRIGDVSLRWVLVHMIEEYARHNGHADLLRERIDGVTGE